MSNKESVAAVRVDVVGVVCEEYSKENKSHDSDSEIITKVVPLYYAIFFHDMVTVVK